MSTVALSYSTILYVSGPMSGYPELNYPAFHSAEDKLFEKGYVVSNPARIDEVFRTVAQAERTYPWYLRHAIEMLLECNAVATLPGWQNSTGARIEVEIAKGLQMPIHPVYRWLTDPVEHLLKQPDRVYSVTHGSGPAAAHQDDV